MYRRFVWSVLSTKKIGDRNCPGINVSEVIDFQFSKNKASRPAKGLTSSVSGTPDDPELFCRAKTDDDGCMASESL
ncbi:hypothetical protein ABEB36_009480 [Hypothenemus hampei]|uniref:Uncharacterized protein n=1 Tax=Hypothenemus hampei TaxID=57062 RepID=A0ABD1EGI4_HYPHA